MIKEGIVESRPFKGSTAVIRAKGKLDDGTEVDVHDELTFTVGDNEVRTVNYYVPYKDSPFFSLSNFFISD